MSFYICKCGNPEKSHNFRHPFEAKAEVDIITREEYNIYADEYPLEKSEKCAVENCSALPGLHGTKVLEHKYQPVECVYRSVKFRVPKEAKCYHCGIELTCHGKMIDHHFACKVILHNKNENDKVVVLSSVESVEKIAVVGMDGKISIMDEEGRVIKT